LVAIKEADSNSSSSLSSSKKPVIILIFTLLALLIVGSLVIFSDQFVGKAFEGIPEIRTVDIQGLAFRPAEITIDAGDTIIWVNRNAGLTHVIQALDNSFTSPPLSQGQTFRRTFSTAGTFDYMDQQRPATMTGRIIVRPAPLPVSNCGNGVLDSGELCDGTQFGINTCATKRGAGYTGSLSCSADCQTIIDTACTPPATCPNGALNPSICDICVTGQRLCGTGGGARCTNTQIDFLNCGICGNTCTIGQTCVAGVCGTTISTCPNGATNSPACNICPVGQTVCGIGAAARCTNIQTDLLNCGTCGTICTTGQTCTAGVCGTATCNNGALNPPLCTNCNTTSRLINSTCILNCNNNATNPPACTACNTSQVLIGNVCINNCTNGALNPPLCDNCPINQTIGINDICVNVCTNNATDPPRCTTCPRTLRMINNICQRDCENNAVNPPTCNLCSDGRIFINNQCSFPCSNGAIDPPACNTCDVGRTLVNGICRLGGGCGNGANNPPACTACGAGEIFSNGQCAIPCGNGATNPPTCTLCSIGQSLVNGQCAAPLVQQQIVSDRTTLSDQGQTGLPTPDTRSQPGTQQPSNFLEQNKLAIFAGGGSLLALILILVVFLVMKGKGAQPNPTLVNYLAKARIKGVPDEVIKENLLNAGWDEKEVNRAFK